LLTPFWKLTTRAPFFALRAISFAAAAVALLLTHKAMTSAWASPAGLVEKSTCSGASLVRQPE
jgi:hypothetical protein